MALYRQGTAAMDAQGTITGTNTKWKEPLSLIRTGATIVFLTSPISLAVISDIVSDTEMKAITTDGGAVADGQYVILLNDSLTVNGMAQDVAETLRYYQSKETVIEEAIEFFKNFDLQQLIDLKNAINADANRTEIKAGEAAASAAASAQSEQNSLMWAGQSYEHKEAAKVSETNAANSAANSNSEANRAKAEADRAATANPDNQLKKANNLSDVADKEQSRINLDVNSIRSIGGYTSVKSADGLMSFIIGGGIALVQDQDGNTVPFAVNVGGTGARDAAGARANLGLGISNTPRFFDLDLARVDDQASGILNLNRVDGNGSAVTQARVYHEYQGGKGMLTLHIAANGKNRYIQFNEDGDLINVNKITNTSVATGDISSNGVINANKILANGIINTTDVMACRRLFAVDGVDGGDKRISLNAMASDPQSGNWVNLLQGNWYTSYWQLGGVRNAGANIDHFKIGINDAANPWQEFKFYTTYGGHAVAARGWKGQCIQGAWGLENQYMGAPFYADNVVNNDGGWSPIVSGGTQSTGGYYTKVALGAISGGAAAWPSATIKILGDGDKHRAYNFGVTGDITTWAQVPGNAWGDNFIFQKAPNSDRDIKHDIVYTEGKESYDRVMQWLPTMFKYNGSDVQRFGFIAQDMNKIDLQYTKVVPGAPIFEEVIGVNEDGEEYIDRHIETGMQDDTLSLDSNVMLVDLGCAFVYQGKQVEKLTKEVEDLKKLVQDLINAK